MSHSIIVSVVLYLCLNQIIHSAYSEFSEIDEIQEFYDNYIFESDDSWPIQNTGNVSKAIKIYAYTSNSADNFTEIIYKDLSTFYESNFDVNKTTKILIHGWRGSAFTAFETDLRRTYQETQDVNLLAVDWSEYASELYSFARNTVSPAGKYLADVLDWLVVEAGVDLATVHVIGHSLGAHISGVIGEYVTNGTLGRISGLDPAGPGFYLTSTAGRLDSSDAQFVDVIHTCGHWAGYFDPCGHVDFYPNKGTPLQPGCKNLVCSHVRAYEFFNESISSDLFTATPCKSWKDYSKGVCDNNTTVPMGEQLDTSARGKFYLHTSNSYPYALGNDSVRSQDNLDSYENTFVQGLYSKTTRDEKHSASPLHQSASSYTKIYLYTRDNPENYTEVIYRNISSITNSAFNTSKMTKVVVHGWLVSAFKVFEEEVRQSYLSTQDVNVLAVDWSHMADGLYFRARSAVRPVGKYLAKVIDWLVDKAGVSVDKIHIIGHSLGAHISGVVGESLTVGNISRITGLDPAGPEFYFTSKAGRLDSSDAQFVDVIHTSGGFFGYYDACGTVDFYPNRGTPVQPGCKVPLGKL